MLTAVTLVTALVTDMEKVAHVPQECTALPPPRDKHSFI